MSQNETDRQKTVAAMSGGLDSGVLIHTLLKRGDVVAPVNIHYGSRHNQFESKAATDLSRWFRGKGHSESLLPLLYIDLKAAFDGSTSALLKHGPPLPAGHYEEETMRQTVVPGRNLIIIAVLAGYAESMKFDEVVVGVHAGDHFIYPDCRPEFVSAACRAVLRSSNMTVGVQAPMLKLTKRDIVSTGLTNGFPFELTRTCYGDQEVACGVCGSCQERLEAFHLNGATDPLSYVTRELLPKKEGP